MTATTDEILNLTRRGQEAVSTAVRSWADTMQSMTGSLATGSPEKLPDLFAFVDSSIDQAFDVAEKMLATQRQIAHTVLAAGAQATKVVTEQAVRTAQSTASRTTNAAADAAENTAAETSAAAKATDGAAEAPTAPKPPRTKI